MDLKELKSDIKKIYIRYYKSLYMYCLKMCGNNHDTADEITQNTFYKAICKAESFRGDSQVFTWLSQIEDGIYNFSLTDTVAHKYSRQRGWMIKDRYQALKYTGDEFPKNPKLSKYENVPVKQINYCDMDGNVIFTLWNEGDEIKEW